MTLDELDKLAAEFVMGWSIHHLGHYQTEEGVPTKYMNTKAAWPPTEHWQPTRNIAQAWECLEKFHHKSVFTWNSDTNDEVFIKCIVRAKNYKEPFEANGTSAPETIVRACLKAKGVDV